MTEAERRFKSLDWRGQLEWAIAYRMAEMYEIEPFHARMLVRDFLRHGPSGAEDPAKVSAAIISMFKPVVQVILPLLPQLASNVLVTVQTQNERGLSAEVGSEAALNTKDNR
jgi:hypothetical protein